MNVDTVLAHTPGQEADTIMGIAAVALHDATIWKERAVTQAAATWSTYAEQQIRKNPGSAHRLMKRDQVGGPDFSTLRHGPDRTAAPCSVLLVDRTEWRAIWTRLGDAPQAPWRTAAFDMTLPPITGNDIKKRQPHSRHGLALE